jgi:hypothetical protein
MSACKHFKVRGQSPSDVQEAAARATEHLAAQQACGPVLVVYQQNAAKLYVETTLPAQRLVGPRRPNR